MIEIEISRLIAAAVAAFLLGYACYVAAYVKHKNKIRDSLNKAALVDKATKGSATPNDVYDEYMLEKTETWYFGYRLALLSLIIVAAAVGWALGWAVGQEHELTWVEDAAVAAAGAVVGGLVLDKYIIHPIADGSFFERVEDPIVQRFLQDVSASPEVKERKLFRKKKKDEPAAEEVKAPEIDQIPRVVPIEEMSFDEKIKLLEILKKSL